MAISISLVSLIAYASIVSALLVWMNAHSVSATRATAATFVACSAIAIVTQLAFGGSISWRGLQYWALFLLLPSAAILVVSRLGLLRAQPLWLIAVGPVTFLLTTVVVMVVYNIFFATNRQAS